MSSRSVNNNATIVKHKITNEKSERNSQSKKARAEDNADK